MTKEQQELKKQEASAKLAAKNAMEKQKLEVEDLELKARYWEAQWRVRFYTLEAEKLQPEYDKWHKAQQEAREKALAEFQAQIAALNQKAEDKEVDVASQAVVKSIIDALPTQ